MIEIKKDAKKIDILCGVASGLVTFKVAKTFLSNISKNGGMLTKTSCFIFETLIAYRCADKFVDYAKQIRLLLTDILNTKEARVYSFKTVQDMELFVDIINDILKDGSKISIDDIRSVLDDYPLVISNKFIDINATYDAMYNKVYTIKIPVKS